MNPPTKAYPTLSVGPLSPSRPLQHAVLRLFAGSPRDGTPALRWLCAAPPSVTLTATLGVHEATLPLADGTSCYYMDFALPCSPLELSVHAPGSVPLYAVLLPTDLLARGGILTRALLGADGHTLASLTLTYIVITPGPTGAPRAVQHRTPRFVGHRGLGVTNLRDTDRPSENTPLSFMIAAARVPGAAVELDVQLTRDGVAIVFHDWFYRPSLGSDSDQSETRVNVPLYTLTFAELNRLYQKMKAAEGGERMDLLPLRKELAGKGWDVPKCVLTPRIWGLREVCEILPEDIDLLVEVKYPPPDIQEEEYLPYPERNEYLDIVLNDLFGGEQNERRKISFLSFDPDICMMLSLKQDVYSIYLSHCEVLDKPCEEVDPRCIDLDNGLHFAASQHLDGMMLYNKLVEMKPDSIQTIINQGLSIITYGDRNSEADFVRNQFNAGIKGVIADRVDRLFDALGPT